MLEAFSWHKNLQKTPLISTLNNTWRVQRWTKSSVCDGGSIPLLRLYTSQVTGAAYSPSTVGNVWKCQWFWPPMIVLARPSTPFNPELLVNFHNKHQWLQPCVVSVVVPPLQVFQEVADPQLRARLQSQVAAPTKKTCQQLVIYSLWT